MTSKYRPLASMPSPEAKLLDSLDLKSREQQRLIDTLHYYRWLESRKLSWDMIVGIRTAMFIQSRFNAIKRDFPDAACTCKLIDFRLIDGSTVILDWPPFSDDVIFNRSFV